MEENKVLSNNEIKKHFIDGVVWTLEPDPKEVSGGQSCGVSHPTLKAYNEELDITISIGVDRSRYKTKLLILTLFELALDELLNLPSDLK